MTIFAFDGIEPNIDPSAYIAPGAVIIGDVRINKDSSVWFQCAVRGDDNAIRIGSETNIQDNTTLHSDPRQVLNVGDRVTIGHGSVIHGCTIEDDCLIGMGAVVMTGARIGRGSIVAARALVREDVVIPPFSLVTGVPGKVVRTYDEDILEKIRHAGQQYLDRLKLYRDEDKLKVVE